MARSTHGVGRLKQFLCCWRLCAVHGIEPEEYYKFRNFTRGDFSAAPHYVQHTQIVTFHSDINRDVDTDILNDKFRFYEFCRKHNLPCIPVYAVFRNGELAWRNEDYPGALPHRDLFLKPHNYWRGLGSELWKVEETPGTWTRGGQSMTEEMLMRHFAELSTTGRDFLLQPRIKNNMQIATFAPGALATIRLVTYRFPDDTPHPLAARLAIPIGNNDTDHDAMGAGVDLETGALRPPIFEFLEPSILSAVDPSKALSEWDCHPTTGVPIAGVKLDGWHDMVTLCQTAHTHLNEFATVGWDVTMTPDGPLIVEGNPTWGHTSSQVGQGVPLGLTRFAECYLAHFAKKAGPTGETC